MNLKSTSKPKILVVDDEQDNLDLLYRTFRRDYKVLRSDNGPEALALLAKEEDDVAVIISDQRMPNMSGTELLSLTAAKYPNTMRIILTGYTDVEDLVDAINGGQVFKYVTKPWNADDLKAIVQQALEAHNLLKIRTEELRRSLRRESLLNSVMGVIRNPRYDNPEASPLQDVLQTIVNTVGQALEADLCLLRPWEGDRFAPRWFVYSNPGLDPNLPGLPGLDLTLSAIREVQAIEDVQAHPFVLAAEDGGLRQAVFQAAQIRSSLVVPLMAQQELLAVMALHHCGDIHHWEEDEIQLTAMVADQAALAISQARAYEQVRALAQREVLINTVTAAIRSSLEPEQIFTAITKQLGQALEVDGCALSLWTKLDEFVNCVGLYDRHQVNGSPLPQSKVPIQDNPVLQKLLATLKPVVVGNMGEETGLNRFDLPLRSQASALLLVPLLVDGELIGSISLRQTGHVRKWSAADIELAEAVASQAAIAVQQSRLYETTRQQAEQLREREQRVQQLNKYLTESVLKRFLPDTMVEKAAAGELVLDLSPEPRLVTILFSDIVGFTPLSNRLGPRLVAELLNEYLEAMTRAVFEHRGTVDKFIGDAVLALFGSPEELSPEEQVNRAIAVARSMYRYLDELNQRWQARGLVGGEGPPPVQFRCGIHQGNAVVGMFGGGQRSDYTAIGPAVNIAARLQEAADPKNILISETVAQYLDTSQIVKVENKHLKGIDGLVTTYSVAVETTRS